MTLLCILDEYIQLPITERLIYLWECRGAVLSPVFCILLPMKLMLQSAVQDSLLSVGCITLLFEMIFRFDLPSRMLTKSNAWMSVGCCLCI